jgi:serine protease Do
MSRRREGTDIFGTYREHFGSAHELPTAREISNPEMREWVMLIYRGLLRYVFAPSILATLAVFFTIDLDPLTGEIDLVQDAHAELSEFRRQLPDIAERAVKSVVNISTSKKMVRSRRQSADPLFRRFFGQRRRPSTERGNSLGSGVVVSKDGLVLTNSHVVQDADDITITMTSGREYKAEVVGADPKSDVAVVRIMGASEDLEPMPIGDSNTLRLGETVLAIGSPFGLSHTVTMGIVSAKGRANMGITDYEDFIQTDAAINPGNSGGALVNTKGELVGINTAIVSRSGGYQGIGFAIPTSMSQSIMNSLVSKGRVSRGWLGVGIQPLSRKLSTRLGLAADTKGVLVNGVMDETPASRGGLQAGDVITHLDGKVMGSPAQLRNTIAMKGGQAQIKLRLIRDGEGESVSLVLGELDDDRAVSKVRKPETGDALGLSLSVLDRQIRHRLDLADAVSGIFVRAVDPGSAGAKAGIKAGDVIQQLDGKKVKTVTQARRSLLTGKGDLLVRVLRRGSHLFAVVERD